MADLQEWVGRSATTRDDMGSAHARGLAALLDRDPDAPLAGSALPPPCTKTSHAATWLQPIAAPHAPVVPPLSSGFAPRRAGLKVILTGEGGNSIIVADYFGDAGLPTLASPTGAVLLPDVVSALAGPQAPGQYAQADDAQAQPGIGSVVTLTGSASVQRNDGTEVALAVDSRLAEGDVVQTGSGSLLSIVFDDGTVFNINADTRMVLDELVYEPGGGSNSMLFSLVQGVFAFVAGQVAPTGEMRIDTPAASMGIRGTSGIVKLETIDGVAVFRVVPDPVTNNVGTIVLYVPGTDIILVVMESSDSQWAIDTATARRAWMSRRIPGPTTCCVDVADGCVRPWGIRQSLAIGVSTGRGVHPAGRVYWRCQPARALRGEGTDALLSSHAGSTGGP